MSPSEEGGVSGGVGGAGGGTEVAGNRGWCRILLALDLSPFAVLTAIDSDSEMKMMMMFKVK